MLDDKKLLEQVRTEYEEARDFLQPRKERWVKQLILLNNLVKGDELISSSSLFAFVVRAIGGLYDGRMKIQFVPPETNDFKRVENLNRVAQNDWQEMGKKMIDYDEIFSCAAFGRAYTETIRYDKKRMLMLPEVISPLMMLHDPYGNKPKSWRYYGYWIDRSRAQLNKLIDRKIITLPPDITIDDIEAGIDPYLWDYKTRQEKAKSANPAAAVSRSPNGAYQLLQWYTVDDDGKKLVVWTDKSFTLVLRRQELDLKDGEDGESRWPLVVKEIFRDPFSSMPMSFIDIMEDKHRSLNVLYNLMYLSAKEEVNPSVAYDRSKVTDPNQLGQHQVSQLVEVEGNPDAAIMPIRKNLSVTPSIAQFISMLKSENSESIGTTQLSSPTMKNKKSATSAALEQQTADLTQSLQSLVLEDGEEEFWSHWYWRHRRYARKADEKVIALTSVTGTSTFSIDLHDSVRTKFPPRVLITDSKMAEYKRMVAAKQQDNTIGIILKDMAPKQVRDYMRHVYCPAHEMDTATVDLIYPKSLSEMKAEDENGLLEDDRLPTIDETDDDSEHIYIHRRASNTASKWAHILTHEEQLASKQLEAQQKENEDTSNDDKKNQKAAKSPLPTPAQAVTQVKDMASTRYGNATPKAAGT